MTFPPNRLLALIDKLSAGDVITQADLDQTAQLQALDIAVAGRQFVEDWIEREEAATARYTEP
jgi:hypothetical protein